MADNIQITPGTGATIAADDVGAGVLVQKLKLVDATDGSSEPIGINQHPLMVGDESIALLRRIVKLLESQATVDVANRQRVTVDAITAGSTTIGAVNIAASQTLAAVTNVAAIANMDHKQFIDQARTAYNTGIRSKLTFS